jgi:hypothetical protein
MNSVKELLDILVLEKQSENKFNGISETIGSPIVFGGQVLAQAVNAAYRTITNHRILNSLHSYFLEAGDLSMPIKTCVCSHAFQDKTYGKFQRVANQGGSAGSRSFRCTVCGKTIAAAAKAKKPSVKKQGAVK